MTAATSRLSSSMVSGRSSTFFIIGAIPSMLMIQRLLSSYVGVPVSNTSNGPEMSPGEERPLER